MTNLEVENFKVPFRETEVPHFSDVLGECLADCCIGGDISASHASDWDVAVGRRTRNEMKLQNASIELSSSGLLQTSLPNAPGFFDPAHF